MLWDALGCSGMLWDALGFLWDSLSAVKADWFVLIRLELNLQPAAESGKATPVSSAAQEPSDISEPAHHNKILRDSQVPSLLLLASPVDEGKVGNDDVVISFFFYFFPRSLRSLLIVTCDPPISSRILEIILQWFEMLFLFWFLVAGFLAGCFRIPYGIGMDWFLCLIFFCFIRLAENETRTGITGVSGVAIVSQVVDVAGVAQVIDVTDVADVADVLESGGSEGARPEADWADETGCGRQSFIAVEVTVK